MKTLITLVFSAIATLFISSCGDAEGRTIKETKVDIANTPAVKNEVEAPAKPIFKLNEAIELGDYVVTVTKYHDNTPAPDELSKPEEGNKFITVEVLYENKKGTRQLEYNPFDWKLVDNDGYYYEVDFNIAKQPVLQSGALSIGQKSRGWITYQAAKTAGNFKLLFEPSGLHNSNVEIKLK
jgi:hypothetical protein